MGVRLRLRVGEGFVQERGERNADRKRMKRCGKMTAYILKAETGEELPNTEGEERINETKGRRGGKRKGREVKTRENKKRG